MRPAFRVAYAILGILFLIVFIAAWYLLRSPSLPLPQPSPKVGTTTSATIKSSMKLTSSAFVDGDTMPLKYTCDGVQTSPPLTIGGVPASAKSLALVMEDPDVPRAIMPSGLYDHWILFNIPATTTQIVEGERVGMSGSNTSGKLDYVGPCPPTQYEPTEHRYIFTLYALDSELPLKEGASKEALEVAMQGHVLAEAQLVAKYKRSDTH